jgi:hypothetical protein
VDLGSLETGFKHPVARCLAALLNLAVHFLNRWPPGARTGPGIDCFHVASGKNVAMTIEKLIDRSIEIGTANWAPKARRHGERAAWTQPPQAAPETSGEPVVAPLSPPPVWPRVFPGI